MAINDIVTVRCSLRTLDRIFKALCAGYVASRGDVIRMRKINPTDCQFFEGICTEIDACCVLAANLLEDGQNQLDPHEPEDFTGTDVPF